MSESHKEHHHDGKHGDENHLGTPKEPIKGEHHLDVINAKEHVSKNVSVRLPLGTVKDKQLKFSESLAGVVDSFGAAAKSVLDLVKDTGSHFANSYKDVKNTPSTSGKILFGIMSFLKIPLETLNSTVNMFIKQGESLGDIIGNLTAYKRIPVSVSNFIRAPFAAVGWLFSPFKSDHHNKAEAINNHH